MRPVLFKAFLPPGIACILWYGFLTLMRWDSEGMGMLFLGVVFAPPVFLFLFLPTLIAAFRRAPRYAAIVVLNVIGSWFFGLGWIAALIWALVDKKSELVVVQHIYQSPPPPQGE